MGRTSFHAQSHSHSNLHSHAHNTKTRACKRDDAHICAIFLMADNKRRGDNGAEPEVAKAGERGRAGCAGKTLCEGGGGNMGGCEAREGHRTTRSGGGQGHTQRPSAEARREAEVERRRPKQDLGYSRCCRLRKVRERAAKSSGARLYQRPTQLPEMGAEEQGGTQRRVACGRANCGQS